MPTGPAPASDVAAVARSLAQDCALLAQSLADLRSVPHEQVEEAFLTHLRQTRALEQRIAASVAHLNARRAEVGRLPGPARSNVERSIAEARCQLEAAAGAYGALAADVADVLASIRRQLDGIRQGSRILRGYRQAAT